MPWMLVVAAPPRGPPACCLVCCCLSWGRVRSPDSRPAGSRVVHVRVAAAGPASWCVRLSAPPCAPLFGPRVSAVRRPFPPCFIYLDDGWRSLICVSAHLNGGLLQVCSTPAAGVRVVAGRGSAVRRAEGGLLAAISLQAQGGSGDGASPRPATVSAAAAAILSRSGWQAAPSVSTPCSCRWSICSSSQHTGARARWLARSAAPRASRRAPPPQTSSCGDPRPRAGLRAWGVIARLTVLGAVLRGAVNAYYGRLERAESHSRERVEDRYQYCRVF